jgi:hypothetical protein
LWQPRLDAEHGGPGGELEFDGIERLVRLRHNGVLVEDYSHDTHTEGQPERP